MKKELSLPILLVIAILSSAVHPQTATRTSEPIATPDESRTTVSNTSLSDSVRTARKYYDSGIASYNSGRPEQAIEAFKEAAKAEPDNAQSHYMLGMSYSKSKAFKEAADSFKRAAQLKPDWPDAHFRYGIMSYVLGRKTQSAQEYSKLVKLNSPLANTLYRIINEDRNAANNGESGRAAKDLSAAKEPQVLPALSATPSPLPRPSPSPVSVETSRDPNRTRTEPDASSPVGSTGSAVPSPSSVKPDTNSDELIRKPTTNDSEALAEIYRVGVGDVLDIRLLNSSTPRSTLYTVIDGGLIDLPIAGGPITVAGLTPDEIQTRIALELKRRAVEEGARVSVGIRQYASHGVVVTGLVSNPGTKFLRREAVPLYVIMAEAQARSDAGRVAVMRVGSAGLPMDLSDPASLNVMIRPGDTISVTARPQEFYYIAGRVNYPGQKTYQLGITLLQAILSAGGTTRQNVNNVEVSRKGPDGLLTTTKYSVKEIKAGKILDPKVLPDDLIDVVN